jgi:glutamine amidotransferase
MNVAVIDYHMGNLRSVSKAIEKAGASTVVTSSQSEIAQADALVLPGVGAFYKGMENLEKLKLTPIIKERIRLGVPFLGICLGMQLLFEESDEHGLHRGLELVGGRVVKFPAGVKIPQIGWNEVKIKNKKSKIKNKLFKEIPDGSFFYFVHSYYVKPSDEGIVVGVTDYGVTFPSIIQKDNIVGVQFHPEKSQELGIKLLENFLNLVREKIC